MLHENIVRETIFYLLPCRYIASYDGTNVSVIFHIFSYCTGSQRQPDWNRWRHSVVVDKMQQEQRKICMLPTFGKISNIPFDTFLMCYLHYLRECTFATSRTCFIRCYWIAWRNMRNFFIIIITVHLQLLSLDYAKLELIYANLTPVFDLLFDGNSNVGAICHHFKDYHSPNVGKIRVCHSKAIWDFIFVDNSNVCCICHRLQENHVWTSRCNRYEYLTLKMKVKNVDDSDKHLSVKIPCQLTSLCRNWRFQVQSFVLRT